MEMNLNMKGPTRLHFSAPVAAGGQDVGDVGDLSDPSDASDVRTIYRAHARFVWLSLQRLGVQPSDLDDVAQDVFVIVHRRLNSFDRIALITTWLFGICLRVAANYRRRRRWTRELLSGWVEDNRPATLVAADEVLIRREEREIAERALDRLDVAKRATFVMFELESLSCLEIAAIMDVPIGTVYSRLHSARREVQKTMARELKRRELGR